MEEKIRALFPEVDKAIRETGVDLWEIAAYLGFINNDVFFNAVLEKKYSQEQLVNFLNLLSKLPANERIWGIDEDGNPKYPDRFYPYLRTQEIPVQGKIISIVRSELNDCDGFYYEITDRGDIGYRIVHPLMLLAERPLTGYPLEYNKRGTKAWDDYQKARKRFIKKGKRSEKRRR